MFPTYPGARHWRTVALPPPLLAHASGFSWDESLLVLAPLVVIGGLLWLANRRAARLQEPGDADSGTAEDPPRADPVPGSS
jgi:hypothetical protein